MLPFSALALFSAAAGCNHVDGAGRAFSDAPRGAWCQAVEWDGRWLLLLVVPPLVALLIAWVAGRGRMRNYVAAWGVGAVLALAPVLIMGALAPTYPQG